MVQQMGDDRPDRRRRSKRTDRDREPFDPAALAKFTPPHNLEAERAVLGSILVDNRCLDDVTRVLTANDFYTAAHQKIFESIRALRDRQAPADLLTVGEELNKAGILMEIGGGPALLQLQDDVLTSAHVMHYAQIVHEKSVMRNLINSCHDILRKANESATNPDELLAAAEKQIFSIRDSRNRKEASALADVLMQVFDRVDERRSREGSLANGVPTPFFDLSEKVLGWQPNEFIILAARPSVGKTAFALNLVWHAARETNQPILFVSLEMSQLEIAERLLCLEANVNNHLLRQGRISEEDHARLIQAGEILSNIPIYIDDTPSQTMMHISASARRIKRSHGLAMIVIDYLQLIEPEDKSVQRVEQIGLISRRTKILARECAVPVMALSQLNRGVESRQGHRPRMSDLRESGSLEQDADVVLLSPSRRRIRSIEKPGRSRNHHRQTA